MKKKEKAPTPSVAVMLATYNGELFLARQIDSILSQNDVRTTIYVRDDHSTDGTSAILISYVSAYPGRLVMLPKCPKRQGSACGNFLSILFDIRDEKFDYFSFADQDDIWDSDKLSRATSILVATGASGYASNLLAFSEAPPSQWTIAKASPQQEFDHLFQSASAGCTYVLNPQAVALIASRVAHFEPQDWTGMSHDWLCYAICRSHQMNWVIDNFSGVHYRQHHANQFGAMPGLRGAWKRFCLIKSGWYRDVLIRNRHFLDTNNNAEQEIFTRIVRLDLRDRFWLALNARKFRREKYSHIALAIMIALGFF